MPTVVFRPRISILLDSWMCRSEHISRVQHYLVSKLNCALRMTSRSSYHVMASYQVVEVENEALACLVCCILHFLDVSCVESRWLFAEDVFACV